ALRRLRRGGSRRIVCCAAAIRCAQTDDSTTEGVSMAFELPPLPYPKDALAPLISAETFDYHHGKHHAAYVTNLNAAIAGTPNEKKSLEEIILSADGPLFN